MASVIKILGQAEPAAATLTDLYTVPSSTEAIISSLMICNTSSVATIFRIAVQIAGASIVNKQYIYYEVNIPGYETFTATLGVTLAATDVVVVYATLATLSFNLFGQEITA